MTTARTKWSDFFTRSLASRLSFSDFKSFAELLSGAHHLPPAQIASIFLAPTPYNDFCLDMRVSRYLLILLDLDLVSISAILSALRQHSTFQTQAQQSNHSSQESGNKSDGKEKRKEAPKRWTMSFGSDETIFYKLTKHLTTTPATSHADEPTNLLHECLAWITLATEAQHQDDVHALDLSFKYSSEMFMATLALATFLVAVIEDSGVQRVLARSRDASKQLVDKLTLFIPLLTHRSPQIAERLQMFVAQTLEILAQGEKHDDGMGIGASAASKEIDRILEDTGGGLELELQSLPVADTPVINSRAGLYIYLNSLVSGLL